MEGTSKFLDCLWPYTVQLANLGLANTCKLFESLITSGSERTTRRLR